MIFDAHLHIIDSRLPPVANRRYLPEPFAVADYLPHATSLDMTAGAVVSASFQACDHTDLPSTRAPRPFTPADIDLVREAFGPELARRALYDIAAAWYRVTP